MADFGAHITITSGDRPSIFDVVAQDSLMSTLQPAVEHALKVLGESNPERYGFLIRYGDEFFTLFNLAIQHHYLKNYGSSFSESFYDLKRVPIRSSKTLESLRLPKRIYLQSLATLVALPYIRNWIDTAYQKTREREADGQLPREGFRNKLLHIFLKLWPLIHFSWEFINFVYYLRYMIGHSRFHTPLLWLCGVRLANLNDDDQEIIEERAQNMLTFKNIRSAGQLGQWCLERLGSSIMESLEVAAFFLQFLDWFYSSGSTPRSIGAKPIPPAPQQGIEKISGMDIKQCPICLKQRKQDTVLTVSGYVFCYSCILLHIRREGKCPVTGYPATTAQIIRIYQQT